MPPPKSSPQKSGVAGGCFLTSTMGKKASADGDGFLKKPRDRIAAAASALLLEQAGAEAEAEAVRALRALVVPYVPAKWEAHGAHLLLRFAADMWTPSGGDGDAEAAADAEETPSAPPAGMPPGLTKALLGAAVLRAMPAVHVVIEERGGVEGELRRPEHVRVLCSRQATGGAGAGSKGDESQLIARHVENGVVYSFDVGRIMFSSGNTTERVHMGAATTEDEVVVDMFAGIGYFTLPVLKKGGRVVALEKNPDSVRFLKRNVVLNKIPAARVVVIEGDNREVGSEHLHTAARVSMGYFNGQEDAAPFLPRAVDFLDLTGTAPTLHYHYLSTKVAVHSTVQDHFRTYLPHVPCFAPDDEEDAATAESRLTARIRCVRKVKSYRPQVYHFVADVILRPAA